MDLISAYKQVKGRYIRTKNIPQEVVILFDNLSQNINAQNIKKLNDELDNQKRLKKNVFQKQYMERLKLKEQEPEIKELPTIKPVFDYICTETICYHKEEDITRQCYICLQDIINQTTMSFCGDDKHLICYDCYTQVTVQYGTCGLCKRNSTQYLPTMSIIKIISTYIPILENTQEQDFIKYGYPKKKFMKKMQKITNRLQKLSENNDQFYNNLHKIYNQIINVGKKVGLEVKINMRQ